MHIYFVAAVSALPDHRSMYERIIRALEDGENKVYSEHIMGLKDGTDDPEPAQESSETYFSQMVQRINSSDLVVAEVSNPTNNIGQEIAYALQRSKPVLGLYNEAVTKKVKPLLVGGTDDTLVVRPYSDKNLENIVREGLHEARSSLTEKFSFTITPMIGDYLEWISKKKNMPRSKYLRSLVEEKVRRDKEYKDSQT